MEANDSTSGASGGEQQQTSGGEQDGGQQSDQALKAVMDRLGQLEEQQQNIVPLDEIDPAELQQYLGGPQYEDDGDAEEPDYGEYEDDEEDDRPTYEEAADQIQEMLRSAVEERVTPIEQARAEEQFQEAVADVEDQYPELLEQEIADAATELAMQVNPEVMQHGGPRAVELTKLAYEAMKAREHAAQEKPAGSERGVTLEAGGGATPDAPQEDIAKQIANAGPDHSDWLGKR